MKILKLALLLIVVISLIFVFCYFWEDLFVQKDEMIYGDLIYKMDVSEKDKEDHLAAIRFLSDSLEAHPDVQKYYLDRAVAYYWLNKYEKALHDVNKAIKIYNRNFRCYFIKGRIYLIMNDLKNAEKEFERIMIFTDDMDLFHLAEKFYYEVQEYQITEKYE